MKWKRTLTSLIHARLVPSALSQGVSTQALTLACSQLVFDRIDPYVLPPSSLARTHDLTSIITSIESPGTIGSNHLHQIVGGNAFNATMPFGEDPAAQSTCTTCTFADDFSNYWTGSLFFRSREGKYKKVKQLGVLYFEKARGGMKIYYFAHINHQTKMRAFPPGFRMRTGDPRIRDNTTFAAAKNSYVESIYYTCLQDGYTRFINESSHFPTGPCPGGILSTIYFHPCWDGVNLDSPDHQSHVAWPKEGFEAFNRGTHSGCPASHPVQIPMIVLETRWDTSEFSPENGYEWPEDGSQPFVWSFGDTTGYGQHADYLFGWRGDSLSKAFTACTESRSAGCGLPQRDITVGNECFKKQQMVEEVEGWLDEMPGGHVADGI
ncbi:hypothetical protein QBC35DRAFT_465555 [Podospora australis]|uniref:DUF1996 domain-containing protein n=1 Tax=Podospora australis TaxID=1536484 RepID=A0AAN6WSG9_9PEZI|nr:hypothetical protein QBC35DRAFT_465555 [Podospora australis]